MTSISRRTTAYQTPWFTIEAREVTGQDPFAPYYILCANDYVSAVAVTATGEIVLVRQYRPAVDQRTLELPSGMIDPGESPEDAIRREIREETGHRVVSLDLMAELWPDVGRLGNRQFAYFAVVEPDPDPLRPEEPDIETVIMPVGQCLTQAGAADGCIHSLNLAVLFLALQQRKLSLP
jgi:ADP-ribose pyrophosphatase